MIGSMERQGKKTDATELRHYIDIQQKACLPDGQGGVLENWTTVQTVAAEVIPISASRRFEYKSLKVEATHWIKVRGEIAIIEANRINFGGRIFEILTIENIQEKGIVKFITCLEIRTGI